MSRSTPVPIIIYSDGACTGNPGPGGWASIVLTPDLNVTELGGHVPETTNNRMEILGALRALEHVSGISGPVILLTDSTYLVRGITQWIHAWRRRGWQNSQGGEIANADLWQRLHEVVVARGRQGSIDWRYVRGHSGIAGNERCDELAVAFSHGDRPELFAGSASHYRFDLTTLPPEEALPAMSGSAGPKKAAHSYLSLVNGVLRRHRSWAECEQMVKGRPGARFKKAMSADDEQAIAKSWGVDLRQIKE